MVTRQHGGNAHLVTEVQHRLAPLELEVPLHQRQHRQPRPLRLQHWLQVGAQRATLTGSRGGTDQGVDQRLGIFAQLSWLAKMLGKLPGQAEQPTGNRSWHLPVQIEIGFPPGGDPVRQLPHTRLGQQSGPRIGG
jgi:hypothetical protein